MPYFYHLLNASLLLVWIVLFFSRKDLRHQMLFMALVSAPLGLTEVFFGHDYWHPLHTFGWFVGYEDILHMFLWGGIAGVVYEELFMKKVVRSRLTHHPYWIAGVVLFGLSFLCIGSGALHFNSMHCALLIMFVAGILSLFLRPDLVSHAVFTGFFLAVIFLGIYTIHLFFFPTIFQNWWFANNLWGVYILHVPLEELSFAFLWGFLAGPMYELVFGLRLAAQKK